VPVIDGEPGMECQIDFARMGLIYDRDAGRSGVVHALILTAVYSRHMFVWLSFAQTLGAVGPNHSVRQQLRRDLNG
jgi:hypothetical protein